MKKTLQNIIIFLILCLTLQAPQKIKGEKHFNFGVGTNALTKEKLKIYPSLSLFIGGNKEKEIKQIHKNMIFDINTREIILQKNEEFQCEESKGCKMISTVKTQKTFLEYQCNVQEIETFLSFQSEIFLEKMTKAQMCDVDLKSENPLKMDVFGISPQSSFWNFLEDNFEFYDSGDTKRSEDIEISLLYSLDHEDPKEFYHKKFKFGNSFVNSYLTLNGRTIKGKSESSRVNFGEITDDNFLIKNVKIDGLDLEKKEKVNLCITTTGDFLLGVKESKKIKENLFKKLCKKGSKCRRYNSFVDKIEDIFITAENGEKLKISKDEFIDIRDGYNVDLAISELSDFEKHCPGNSDIALGLQFFASNELNIIKKRGYNRFSVFINKAKIPENGEFRYTSKYNLWRFLGNIMEISIWVILALFLLYVMVVRKKMGHKSRSVKDTTKYRPYVFGYEPENDEF